MNRIIPSTIFILILAFTVFLGGRLPYFILYIFLFTYILPLVHCLISYMSLKGHIIIPSQTAFIGETICLSYRIDNTSIFPINYLRIYNGAYKSLTGLIPPEIILSMEKKGFYIGQDDITIRRRGYYQFGEIDLTIRDVFGFYSLRKKISSNTSLLVYPRITSLSTFKIVATLQVGDLQAFDSAFQDKSRTHSLREYKVGDSVKSIHWKLSAKQDTPIVKEYENRGDTNVNIFINNNVDDFKEDIENRLEDKIVDIGLSIVNYCLEQNVSVKLETQNEGDLVKLVGQSKSDLKPFLISLAKFQANGRFDFASFLAPRVEGLDRKSAIIIISPLLDRAISRKAINMKMKNFNPLFILVTDKDNNIDHIDKLMENRLRAENIPIYILDYKSNIKDALEVYNG